MTLSADWLDRRQQNPRVLLHWAYLGDIHNYQVFSQSVIASDLGRWVRFSYGVIQNTEMCMLIWTCTHRSTGVSIIFYYRIGGRWVGEENF